MNCEYSLLSTVFQQRCQAENAAVSRHCAAFQGMSCKHQTEKNLKSAQCGSESHHQHQSAATLERSTISPVLPSWFDEHTQLADDQSSVEFIEAPLFAAPDRLFER